MKNLATIKLLQSEIRRLNKLIGKANNVDPEMTADLIWAGMEIDRAKTEIVQHQDTIKMLIG